MYLLLLFSVIVVVVVVIIIVVGHCTVPTSRCTKHNHEKLSPGMIRTRKTNVLNVFLIQQTRTDTYS